MLSTFTLIFVLLTFGVLYLSKKCRRPKGFPPGPFPLPWIGNFHQLGLESYKTFMKMGKKYGGIFAVDFGSFRGVVINDPKLIRESLNMLECAGRPKLAPWLVRGDGVLGGIVFGEGHEWSEQRRFVLKSLRDFGFAKNSMESLMHDEINDLVESFQLHKGEPVSTKQKFNVAVLNSLWILCTGERLSYTDPRIKSILNAATVRFESAGPTAAYFFFPTLTKIFPNLMGFNVFLFFFHKARNFVTEIVEDRKQHFVKGSSRNLMEVYFNKLEETIDPNSTFYNDIGGKKMIMAFTDLFQAGSETTSNALTWFFLLLALHPEVQEKFYNEIIENIGNSRLPVLEDKRNMKYTEALIMEVLRYSSLVPLGLYHNTTEEVIIGGYIIPKDTLIVANQYAALQDPKIWGDPENFRPERFIKPDGSVDTHIEAYIPFSTGKRICLGLSFALDQLFLFSVSIIQKFKVIPDPKKPKPTTAYHPGIVLLLKPHELIFKERN